MRGTLTLIESRTRDHPFESPLGLIEFDHEPEPGFRFLFNRGYTTEVQRVKTAGTSRFFHTKNSGYRLDIEEGDE